MRNLGNGPAALVMRVRPGARPAPASLPSSSASSSEAQGALALEVILVVGLDLLLHQTPGVAHRARVIEPTGTYAARNLGVVNLRTDSKSARRVRARGGMMWKEVRKNEGRGLL